MAHCLIPDWHPARREPFVIYQCAESKLWVKLNGGFTRIKYDAARALLALGARTARKEP